MCKLMDIIDELQTEFPVRKPKSHSEADFQASYAAQRCFEYFATLPVKISKAMEELGFDIRESDFDGDKTTSGVMVINAGGGQPSKIVGVNVNDSFEHQRFSLGHELGHFIFDVDKLSPEESVFVRYNTSADNISKLDEYRANKFAANLLMPEVEFRKIWNQLTPLTESGAKMAFMANFFMVPLTAVRLRLKELKIG